MGTSMSSKGPGGGNPLVPPWAEDGDTVVISGDDGKEETEISNQEVQTQIPEHPPVLIGSNRFKAARRSFGEYAQSGNRDDLKRSLKNYSKNSTGKGKGSAKRLASGITAGTGLFGFLSGNSVTTQAGSLNLSELTGLSTDQAIDQITEQLTPNSADSDNVRTALNYALSEALEEYESFDDVQFTPEIMGEVFTCYMTDLIFQQVVLDMGESWFRAETVKRQIYMENELRELIKVIVDSKLDKAIGGDFSTVCIDQITKIQTATIQETIDEWENY